MMNLLQIQHLTCSCGVNALLSDHFWLFYDGETAALVEKSECNESYPLQTVNKTNHTKNACKNI